jgi:hypothetical protein
VQTCSISGPPGAIELAPRVSCWTAASLDLPVRAQGETGPSRLLSALGSCWRRALPQRS